MISSTVRSGREWMAVAKEDAETAAAETHPDISSALWQRHSIGSQFISTLHSRSSNLAWLEPVYKEIDHQDASGDEQAALRLIQLHACCRWGLICHIQGHGGLKPQSRGLCRALSNLHNIFVIPVQALIHIYDMIN